MPSKPSQLVSAVVHVLPAPLCALLLFSATSCLVSPINHVRRLQHLELIRERAALGKDFDRRDSFAAGFGSGRQSPVNASGRPSRQLRSPVPDAPGSSSDCSSGVESSAESSGSRPARSASKGSCAQISTQASSVSLGGAASTSGDVSQGPAAQQAAGTAGLLPCDVFNQLQGNSQSIAAAGLTAAPTSIRSSMKGARRRMAKARHRMQQPG